MLFLILTNLKQLLKHTPSQKTSILIFFMTVAGKKEALVVEIKAVGDDSNKNKAKMREGKKHFVELNQKLKAIGLNWTLKWTPLSRQIFTEFKIEPCSHYSGMALSQCFCSGDIIPRKA